MEATTGLLFGAAAYEFGLSLALLHALVFISALISLAVIDLEHRLLPNAIVGPAALAGLALSVLESPRGGDSTSSLPPLLRAGSSRLLWPTRATWAWAT